LECSPNSASLPSRPSFATFDKNSLCSLAMRHALFGLRRLASARARTESSSVTQIELTTPQWRLRNPDEGEYSSILASVRSHLITLSARTSTLGGIVRPICLAVLRLIESSNFVGCSMGSSLGLVPLRILSTWWRACCRFSDWLGP
jgi:hypothetical protein